jgi:hypothetical protein
VRVAGVLREKLLALGNYEHVTLKEARDKRDAAKKLLRDGIDPATHREEKRAAAEVTFKLVGEEWLKSKGYASARLAKARRPRNLLPATRRNAPTVRS